MYRLNIGIAGAGISGLIAGIELQNAGHSVSIFEARSRTGGRIESLQVEGLIVETGPEFIHGKLIETIGLLKKYKIQYDRMNGKMYDARGAHLRVTYEMAEGWDQLLDKMKSLEEDLPFGEFLEKKFPDNRFIELKKSAVRFAEGFDLADVQTASTQALILEWEHEESKQFRIPSGYGTLIRALENEFKALGGKIYLSHPVKTVDWNSNKILLSVNGNQVFEVDKLIISLPLSVLNREALASESVIFLPPLEEKKAAFNQIGFGTVIKIVMIWDSSFWKSMIPDGQFIFSDHFVPAWWTQYPLDLPMLTGWLGGPKAAQFADRPDGFFLDKAMESLSSIFSIPPEEIRNHLKEARVFNWKNEPWSRGAYSYSLIGFRKTIAVCREPVENRIYFAGEAFYDGPYPGTVEAAVVSGLETARLLKLNA
jgi:monoamine oxidase